MKAAKSTAKKRFVIEVGKHSIISIKDVRNIAQRAVSLSQTSNTVKVTYPFEHGLQIDVNYKSIKSLFEYAMAYGVLMNEVNPGALLDNKTFAPCTFFCCANCKRVGKEHQDKLIKNYCVKCAKTYIADLNEKTAERFAKFKVIEVKEIPEPEPVFSPYLKAAETKAKIKRVNPLKLKHK